MIETYEDKLSRGLDEYRKGDQEVENLDGLFLLACLILWYGGLAMISVAGLLLLLLFL